MSLNAAEITERVLALPPAGMAMATMWGMPLSDISAGLMIVYALLLIAWHIWSKWLGKGGKAGKGELE